MKIVHGVWVSLINLVTSHKRTIFYGDSRSHFRYITLQMALINQQIRCVENDGRTVWYRNVRTICAHWHLLLLLLECRCSKQPPDWPKYEIEHISKKMSITRFADSGFFSSFVCALVVVNCLGEWRKSKRGFPISAYAYIIIELPWHNQLNANWCSVEWHGQLIRRNMKVV